MGTRGMGGDGAAGVGVGVGGGGGATGGAVRSEGGGKIRGRGDRYNKERRRVTWIGSNVSCCWCEWNRWTWKDDNFVCQQCACDPHRSSYCTSKNPTPCLVLSLRYCRFGY